MNESNLIIAIVIVLAGVYLLGRNRARKLAHQGAAMHSLPTHYGALLAIWTGLPALLLLLLWTLFEPVVIDRLITNQLPLEIQQGSSTDIKLALSKVYNLATSAGLSADVQLQPAVDHLLDIRSRTDALQTTFIAALILLGGALCWRRIRPNLRARVEVETVVRYLLLLSSILAVLTTLGILGSVVFEAWMSERLFFL